MQNFSHQNTKVKVPVPTYRNFYIHSLECLNPSDVLSCIIYMYTHTHTHTHPQTYIHTYIQTYTYMYTCLLRHFHCGYEVAYNYLLLIIFKKKINISIYLKTRHLNVWRLPVSSSRCSLY